MFSDRNIDPWLGIISRLQWAFEDNVTSGRLHKISEAWRPEITAVKLAYMKATKST